MFDQILGQIRKAFGKEEGFISLHEPRFVGNEKKYVLDAIDSTFVSSVGQYVDLFEKKVAEYTGAGFAIATANGTAALHIALLLAGVKRNDLVITQALSFIATCNAISYIGAEPVFVDIEMETLGMSPASLITFLETKTQRKNDGCYHVESGRRIAACVPMHTFGHAVDLDAIVAICNQYGIPLIEDAAESIGSTYKGRQTGTFGMLGAISFNGNKTITCGGGGVILTNDEKLAKLAKHLTTQAKMPHRWEFDHDMIGYNYRMPNLNAAMACAQLEKLDSFIEAKRELARLYEDFFAHTPVSFFTEPANRRSNYWLNCIFFEDRSERDVFIEYSNDRGVMTRPVWKLLNQVAMFRNCYRESLQNAEWVSDRLVNIPSSAIL